MSSANNFKVPTQPNLVQNATNSKSLAAVKRRLTEAICNGNSKSKRTSYYGLSEVTEKPDEFPIYIAMANLVITPSGFADVKTRDAICSKIRIMSGDISYAYTDRTTHLLAAHANTSKVVMGRERNLPIVTVEWIQNIWTACQQNNPYIHASLPQFQNHVCPLFYNLHFVFSDRYDTEVRRYYENLVKEHGGSIEKVLQQSSTHFYICQEVETSRQFKAAQKRKVPCLSHAWIIESISLKNLAPPDDYEARELKVLGTTFDISDAPQPRHGFRASSGATVDLEGLFASNVDGDPDDGAYLDLATCLIPESFEDHSMTDNTLNATVISVDIDKEMTFTSVGG